MNRLLLYLLTVVLFGNNNNNNKHSNFHLLLALAEEEDQATTTTTTSSSNSKNVHEYLNVYGNELQSCSYNGTALTGYNRTGLCVEQSDDDHGSHHICINLNMTTGGDFCDVTGQQQQDNDEDEDDGDNNWCSSNAMPCHEDPNNATCTIEHWCVCQWAFASYITKTSCDDIGELDCDATNIEAMRAYQTTYGQKKAFDCITERCGLNPNVNYRTSPVAAWTWFASASLLVAVFATLFTFVYQTKKQERRKSASSTTTASNSGSTVIDSSTVVNKAALLDPEMKQQHQHQRHRRQVSAELT